MNRWSKVIVLKGLPASGKSTWAAEQVVKHPDRYCRVNKDSLRAMLHNGRYSKLNESVVRDARDAIIVRALLRGQTVIVDDTNFDPTNMARIQQIVRIQQVVEECGAEVEVEERFFDVPVDECVRRDAARERPVGEKVIREMAARYLKPKVATLAAMDIVPYVPDETLPKAIICDLDGTLCLFDHHRGPYDHDRCGDDNPNMVVRDVLARFADIDILFVSGREEKYRRETIGWLYEHVRSHTTPGIDIQGLLLMRATGDRRNDALVKYEIFDEHIRNAYNVLFTIDDRERVVAMWRTLGLVCLQVADGNF